MDLYSTLRNIPGSAATGIKINTPKPSAAIGVGKLLGPGLQLMSAYEIGNDLVQSIGRGEGYGAIPGMVRNLFGGSGGSGGGGGGGVGSLLNAGQEPGDSELGNMLSGRSTYQPRKPRGPLKGSRSGRLLNAGQEPGDSDLVNLLNGGGAPIEPKKRRVGSAGNAGGAQSIDPNASGYIPPTGLPSSPEVSTEMSSGLNTAATRDLTYDRFGRDILDKLLISRTSQQALSNEDYTIPTGEVGRGVVTEDDIRFIDERMKDQTSGTLPVDPKSSISAATSGIKRGDFSDIELTEEDQALIGGMNLDKGSRAFLDYSGPGGALGALRARDDALDLAYVEGNYYGVNRDADPTSTESMVLLKADDARKVTNREQSAQDLLSSYKEALKSKDTSPVSTEEVVEKADIAPTAAEKAYVDVESLPKTMPTPGGLPGPDLSSMYSDAALEAGGKSPIDLEAFRRRNYK